MSDQSSYSNKKGTHNVPKHRSIAKKRKFTGNRFTFEQSTANTSTSAEKLLQNNDNNVVIDPSHGYCILQFLSVFSAISNLVVCKTCQKKVTFNQASSRGLGFKIAIICECGNSYINSGPMINNAFEINKRIVAVMRLLGIGINGINLFCGLMDLACKFYDQTFAGCFTNLHIAAETVCKLSMQQAINEEKELTLKKENSETNLTVSGDGTWKKRGHTSRFGVVTLAGKYSKKILDSCVKSTYCQSCVFGRKKKIANLKIMRNGYHYTMKNVMPIIKDLPQKWKWIV
ncbi:uncharacterized protein LOC141536903 [Cotesia typhae]|uniref:uncharacterized protein LOC141536903 n=1 Tax=Cotesia typhae TaxID=2053667 RepID=UPI003D688570